MTDHQRSHECPAIGSVTGELPVNYKTGVKQVGQRMPGAVAREPLPLDLDITLHVAEPPGEHPWRDVFEDAVLDPVLPTTVVEGLDSGVGRRDLLELPEKREWLWKIGALDASS